MLKIVDWMRNKILVAAVFEEVCLKIPILLLHWHVLIIFQMVKKEDFQPMNYNFKFCQDIQDSIVSSNLKSIEDSCAKAYRVCF